MLWAVVEKIVLLITLVMLAVIIVVIVSTHKSSQDFTHLEVVIEQLRTDNDATRAKNFAYIDKRLNTIQEQQDSYQILADRRLKYLENAWKYSKKSEYYNNNKDTTNINIIGTNVNSK